MDKERQRTLIHWLRQQRRHSHPYLMLSTLFGVVSALLIVAQAWLMAELLDQFIVMHASRALMTDKLVLLFFCFLGRAVLGWLRELCGHLAGERIRRALRQQLLDRLHVLGPAWIQGKPAGSWTTLLLEQVENLQDYYARYLPQMTLAVVIPLFILVAIFPVNWMAGLILLVVAPLIPFFMALVGARTADTSRRHFRVLSRLSGDFLDRLRGLDTLRLFHRGEAEIKHITASSEAFRQNTMAVLRLAFLSSAVLEFFASISIALVAVYFGFSYLGELNFGHYGQAITLFAGFFALILAPEFFQPLRDLGTFYHAKAQAVGAAEELFNFLEHRPVASPKGVNSRSKEGNFLSNGEAISIEAKDLIILSPQGERLAGPLNFSLPAGKRVALIGQSGAGKSSVVNLLLGFLPYEGSLKLGSHELRELCRDDWHPHVFWVGQNPHLPAPTVLENITAGAELEPEDLEAILVASGIDEFLSYLPAGINTHIGEQACRLSVGQAQRIAIARALVKGRRASPCHLFLLDEPAASLDVGTAKKVMKALLSTSYRQTSLLVTHRLDQLECWDEIWVMQEGLIVQQGPWQEVSREHALFAAWSIFSQKTVEGKK